jgi:Carboxypeptidase regulatory-like domain
MLANRGQLRWLPHFIFAGVLLLLSGWALPAQEQEGNITGEIRLVDGSFPNSQVQVSLEAHGSVADVTYSDSEGRFSFNHVLPNAYSVVINAQGYLPFREAVMVNPTVMQTNYVHVVLRADPRAAAPAAPNAGTGENADVVSVADLLAKYPPEVKTEYVAGQKAEANIIRPR